MIDAFDITTVRSSPAQMDLRKLLWMNGEYIRGMKPDDFAELAEKEVPGIVKNPAVCELLQPRTKLPSEIGPAAAFFFTEEFEYDQKAVEKKLAKPEVFQTLEKITGIFQGLEEFDAEIVNTALHNFVEQGGLKFGDVMPPLRIAVSGQQSGPDLAPVLAILGKEKSIARIRKTIERFRG
jgi:glutamyl-tRNA synthetase